MIYLPKECEVNKFIPKKTFYEKISISNTIKQEFVEKIEKITWKYKVSEDNIQIPKTENVEEIQVFIIDLKEKYNAKNILTVIARAIPYPILFVLKHTEEFMYAIKYDNDIYFSEWNEKKIFEMNAFSLEKLYEKWVKSIIKIENSNLQEEIDKIEKIKQLQDEIKKLEKKIKNEKQFNRKLELNKKINDFKNEIERMENNE